MMEQIRREVKILVVEDDIALNNLIQRTLQEKGLSTEGAFSGREALARAASGEVAMLILDYRLKDMSGKEVIEALSGKGIEIPFIVSTGHGDERIAVEMMKLGAREYIVKDVNLIEMLSIRVDKVLRDIAKDKVIATVDKVLQESETKVKSILAASPTGIALLKNGVISWASIKFADMTGYQEDQITGREFRMFYENDEEYRRVNDIIYQGIEEKGRGETDTRYRRADGSVIDVNIQASPLEPSNMGKGIIFSSLDITDRKRAEKELAESRQDWMDVFNNVVDMITVHDIDFNIIRANKAAEKILGLPLLSDLKAKCFRFYHGTACPPEGCPSCNCLNTGESASFELFEPHLNKFIEIRAMPRFNAEKKIIGLIHVVRDMTERKKMEEGLFESEERLRSIIDSATDAVISIDASGKIIFFNSTTENLFGYSADELAGRNISMLMPGRFHDAHAKGIKRVSEGGEEKVLGKTVEMAGLRKGGSEFPAEITLAKWRARDELFFTGIIRDITERHRADELLQRQLKRINALHSMDMAITSSLDLRVTLDVFLEQVVTQLEIDAAAVLLFNDVLQTLDYYVNRGFRSKALKHTKLKIGESNAGLAARERRVVYLPDLSRDTNSFKASKHFSEENFVSYFAVPLAAKGQIKGVLELFHRTRFEADEDWLDFLVAIATQAAIAIDDSMLFQDLQRYNINLKLAYDSTIEGWAHALDLRDKETEGHSRRVTDITVAMAREMGIEEDEMVHIRRGALLHDIGKMGIPDRILLKPGKLTDEEWVIMRNHTQLAFEMLSRIDYLNPALDIPVYHHEKWDGSGYPKGIKGNEIPLAARIFAIVDVWDALSSDRPYRDSWPEKDVVDYLKTNSGTHFDPEVVEVFLSKVLPGIKKD
ncbi:MAG: PAS domain S-box protein [Nitrospirae bacterium]|nr:PAS domain S-box protein [Nitrospirota bacterium]